MELVYGKEFGKEYQKIKGKTTRLRIQDALQKLLIFPYAGKPLQYRLAGCRSLRVGQFRIIYRIEGGHILILAFGNRSGVYE